MITLISIVAIILVCVVVIVVVKSIQKEHQELVVKNSKMYKDLLAINKSFKFHKINGEISFFNSCNSKKQLEKFDFTKKLKSIISGNLDNYELYVKQIHYNAKKWNEYLTEYKKTEKYATKEDIKDLKISIKAFNKYEKQLFNENKLDKPATTVKVHLSASYVTPAKKNTYKLEKSFSQNEFEKFVKEEREKIEMDKFLELEKKTRIEEREKQKRQKAITAAQNEKKHQELLKREEELTKKEKEFTRATKGHIYAVEYSSQPIQNDTKDETQSLWTKLKTLKQQFDNGEITYKEYEEKREILLKK